MTIALPKYKYRQAPWTPVCIPIKQCIFSHDLSAKKKENIRTALLTDGFTTLQNIKCYINTL